LSPVSNPQTFQDQSLRTTWTSKKFRLYLKPPPAIFADSAVICDLLNHGLILCLVVNDTYICNHCHNYAVHMYKTNIDMFNNYEIYRLWDCKKQILCFCDFGCRQRPITRQSISFDSACLLCTRAV